MKHPHLNADQMGINDPVWNQTWLNVSIDSPALSFLDSCSQSLLEPKMNRHLLRIIVGSNFRQLLRNQHKINLNLEEVMNAA
jgi:hypothetical protein